MIYLWYKLSTTHVPIPGIIQAPLSVVREEFAAGPFLLGVSQHPFQGFPSCVFVWFFWEHHNSLLKLKSFLSLCGWTPLTSNGGIKKRCTNWVTRFMFEIFVEFFSWTLKVRFVWIAQKKDGSFSNFFRILEMGFFGGRVWFSMIIYFVHS